MPQEQQPSPSSPLPSPGLNPQSTPDVKTGKGALFALVGATAGAVLLHFVPAQEGTRYKAYRDVVGIWTVCTGDTHNVRPGVTETPAQCEDRLVQQLIIHAKPIIACVPTFQEPGHDYQIAASVSLGYNIGSAGFCKSSIASAFRGRLWRTGCGRFRLYNKSGGRVIRGLTDRRARETVLCLKGL
jgi:lysozyme